MTLMISGASLQSSFAPSYNNILEAAVAIKTPNKRVGKSADFLPNFAIF
jgi:hypothetical protein